MTTIPQLFEEVTEWHPETVAFVQGDDPAVRYTYDRFHGSACRFATSLVDAGVSKGDRVVFFTETDVNHAIAYHGTLLAGAVPAAVHTRESLGVVRSIVEELDPAAAVVHPDHSEFVSSLHSDCVVVSTSDAPTGSTQQSFDSFLAGGSTDPPAVDIAPSDTAFIAFTSGTTGRSKGIVHTHEEAVESAKLAQPAFRIKRSDVALNHYSTSFGSWHLMTYSFTLAGATVVFLEEWDPGTIPELVDREEITFWFPVVTNWKQVLQEDLSAYDLSTFDRIGAGGESMSSDLLERLTENVCADFMRTYGSTETMMSVSLLYPEEITPETKDSSGAPVPAVEIRIVDPESRNPDEPVEQGVTGEIFVRGPSVAEAVWNDPEQTENLFHEDGWWMSGDLGKRGADGFLYVVGRKDNVISSGGINIYPESVEDTIEKHPHVIECGIIGIPDEDWGEVVKAFVKTDDELAETELDEWCRNRDDISNYARPKAYAFVDELPRTPSGKLDHSALTTLEE